jgi:hypothetical protein
MSKKSMVFAVATLTSTALLADITLMSPQKPGKGTSVWTNIIATEFAKAPSLNGENVVITYNPGTRDMAGPNKFHASERFNDNTILVSHGGNGISYVQENVQYDFTKYDSVCHQNLNIIMAKTKGVNEADGISHAMGSGMVPEAMAITMMIGGAGKTVDEYITIFKDTVGWVAGMTGSERDLAFARGELTSTRQNPAKYLAKVMPLVRAGKAETWLHHGILDIENGGHNDDPNYPGKRFEDVFEAKWGEKPSGELYAAYTLIHSWRDAIQKALWVNKGNPNTAKFRQACAEMSQNPASIAVFEKKIGKYDWVIGEDGNKTIDVLHALITEDALRTLVKFNKEALGLNSVYKPKMVAGSDVNITLKTEQDGNAWYEFWK